MSRFIALYAMFFLGLALFAPRVHAVDPPTPWKNNLEEEIRRERERQRELNPPPARTREEIAQAHFYDISLNLKDEHLENFIREQTRELAKWIQSTSNNPNRGLTLSHNPPKKILEFIDLIAYAHSKIPVEYTKIQNLIKKTQETRRATLSFSGSVIGWFGALIYALITNDPVGGFDIIVSSLGGGAAGFTSEQYFGRKEREAAKHPSNLKNYSSYEDKAAKTDIDHIELILDAFYSELKNLLPGDAIEEFQGNFLKLISEQIRAVDPCSLALLPAAQDGYELRNQLNAAPTVKALPPGKGTTK